MRKTIAAVLVLHVFFLTSCAVVRFAGYYASPDPPGGRLSGLVYESEDTSYEIGDLGENWSRIAVKGGDIAFLNASLGATITVDSTCGKEGDYSLKSLSDSLLIGIRDKRLRQREDITVDNEKALKSIYDGAVNATPLMLCVVVFKKGDCIYDLSYVASPDSFYKALDEFEKFVSGIRVRK